MPTGNNEIFNVIPRGKNYIIQLSFEKERLEKLKTMFLFSHYVTVCYGLPMHEGFEFVVHGKIRIHIDLVTSDKGKCLQFQIEQLVPDAQMDSLGKDNVMHVPDLDSILLNATDDIANYWMAGASKLFKEYLTMH